MSSLLSLFEYILGIHSNVFLPDVSRVSMRCSSYQLTQFHSGKRMVNSTTAQK